MDLNRKILEDSKVITSIFEDEDIDEYEPNEIFSNLNISNNQIKLIHQFYSNDFDLCQNQLIQLINAFNILDNINLLGAVVLYKLGKYEYNINLNIPEEYFKSIALSKEEKFENKDKDEDVLLLVKYDQVNILEYFDFEPKEYFIYSCMCGSFEVLKWLCNLKIKNKNKYLNGRFLINIHADNETPFITLCINGYLEIAKWLYNLGIERNSPINIHADNEYAFLYTCENGHLDVLKWLYNLGIETNLPIDIHYENEEPFLYACMNGHLEVAKWLHNLGNEPNSAIEKMAYDNAFKIAYKNKHLDVAKWLYNFGIETDFPIDINILNS